MDRSIFPDRFDFGRAAKAAKASQPSSVPGVPWEQFQPPSSLVFEEPIIQLPHPVVVAVAETGQQTSGVPDGAHFLGEDVDHGPQLELVLEEAIRDLSDPRVPRSEAQVGENESPPSGGDILWDAEKFHPFADVRRLVGLPEPFRFLESQYVPGPTDPRYLGMSFSHFGVVFPAVQ